MRQLALATVFLSVALAMGTFSGCSEAQEVTGSAAETQAQRAVSVSSMQVSDAAAEDSSASAQAETSQGSQDDAATAESATPTSASGGLIDGSELFTDRDLQQSADLTSATEITLASGENVEITQEGVYVLSGTAENVTITVEAGDSDKVQLVLDGVTITNETAPAIYVKNADKVFVTTAEDSTNTLAVTGEFAVDGDTNLDGVVFSKDDIVFNGAGALVVNSSANGLVGKDDVKVTGGTYEITAANHAIQGKDSVAIADGTFTLQAGKDGIHAENSDDTTKGYVYIAAGTFSITAASDGIEGDAFVQIDGGSFSIDAAEGIEGTYVQVNGGDISINASDDGINATSKATAYSVPTIEINGGNVVINMGSGDTDALDANGNLYINGGSVDITAQFAFDFDGEGQLNGGTVTVNGEQVTSIENSMMMGGQMGGGMPQDGQMGAMPQDGGRMGAGRMGGEGGGRMGGGMR